MALSELDICLIKQARSTLLFVFATAWPMPNAVAQLPSQTVVARVEMELQMGDEIIDEIQKGDLLTVVESRDDSYVVLTHNGKRGVVGKNDAIALAASVEIYNQLINESPKQGRLFTLRASVWWSRGETKRALEDYDRAIEIGYKEPHAFSSRGLFHAALGNYDQAIADFSTAIDRGATSDAPFVNRAAVYLSQEKHDLALKDYGEAIRRAPDSPTAYQLRAVLYKSRGDLDLAISDFAKAIEVDPDNIPAMMGRGYIWFQKGYWHRAIEDFTAVINIDPDAARAHNNRGYNWQLIGDYKKALMDYENAIRAAPKFALAYQNKAWLLAAADDDNIRNGKRAIEAARMACELSKHRVAGDLRALAAALAEDGQFDEAIRWQIKAIELSVDHQKPLEQEILKKYENKQPIRFSEFQSDDS